MSTREVSRIRRLHESANTLLTEAGTPCSSWLTTLGPGNSGDIDCCQVLSDGSSGTNWHTTQPNGLCSVQWTNTLNQSPWDGWKNCCSSTPPPPPPQISCDSCNNGAPTSNWYPGPNCPTGTIPSGTGNPCGPPPTPCKTLVLQPRHTGCCQKCTSGSAQGTPCQPHCACCTSQVSTNSNIQMDMNKPKNDKRSIKDDLEEIRYMNELYDVTLGHEDKELVEVTYELPKSFGNKRLTESRLIDMVNSIVKKY